MKKQVSTLSLIALAALSIWQYFTEHKKDTKPTPTTTQQQTQSAVKNDLHFFISFITQSHQLSVQNSAKKPVKNNPFLDCAIVPLNFLSVFSLF